jgi:hypothetical protein
MDLEDHLTCKSKAEGLTPAPGTWGEKNGKEFSLVLI